jgi:hypothetical protein
MPEQPEPIFFPVSPLKLVVMSTVTFGFYEAFWFYKNWQLIKLRTQRQMQPFWRAVFPVFFCYSLFKEIHHAASQQSIAATYNPLLLAVAWIALRIAIRFPDPYWLVVWLSPLILLIIQQTVNRLNTSIAPAHDPNSHFSAWNILGIVVGGILFLLTIVGTFIPEVPAQG